MNPWAFVIILLGIVLIIIGVKGTQHNVTSAITNKVAGSSGSSSAAQPPSTGPLVGP